MNKTISFEIISSAEKKQIIMQELYLRHLQCGIGIFKHTIADNGETKVIEIPYEEFFKWDGH